MAKNDNLQDLLQSVADAIRAKKGTTGTINAQDFDSEIASITGGGGGLGDNTKEVIKDISGVESTDDVVLANAIAKAYADTPTEQTWQGTRATADGGTIKDGVAFVESVKGSTIKINQLVKDATLADSTQWRNLYASNASYLLSNNVVTLTTLVSSGRTGFIENGNTQIDVTHTYLCYFDMRVTGTTSINVLPSYYGSDFGNFKNVSVDGNWASYSVVTKPKGTTNINGKLCLQFLNTATDVVIEIKNYVVVDLTAMGQESLTADTLASYCGYSSPSDLSKLGFIPSTNLRNFTHNEVVSKSDDYLQLPNGYTRKDYIESHGTEVIKTAYIPKDNTEVRARFQQVTKFGSYPKLFGSERINKNLSYKLDLRAAYYIGFSTDELNTSIQVGTEVNEIVFKKGSFTSNTSTYTFTATELGASTYPLYIFASNRSNTVLEPSACRLYSFKCYEDGVLKANFVPCTDSEGVACLYESVGNHTYYNEGTGTFDLGTNRDNFTDTLSLNVPSSVFPNGMRSNGEKFDEWIPGEGKAVKRIGDDGEVLDTPLTYNLTKVKAFYKVANGGTESVSGGTDSAPIKADIGYREATATELINALNG